MNYKNLALIIFMDMPLELTRATVSEALDEMWKARLVFATKHGANVIFCQQGTVGGTHLNREKIESNLSVPGHQGLHQKLQNEPPLDMSLG